MSLTMIEAIPSSLLPRRGISNVNDMSEIVVNSRMPILTEIVLRLVRQCRLDPLNARQCQLRQARQCRRGLLNMEFHAFNFLIVGLVTNVGLVMLRLWQCPVLQQINLVPPALRGDAKEKAEGRVMKVRGGHPPRPGRLRLLRLFAASNPMPRRSKCLVSRC